MLVSKRKYDDLKEELNRTKEVLKSWRAECGKLQNKLKNELEIQYRYNFPQNPKAIIVSQYIADNFLHNKVTFVPKVPFGTHEFQGLDVRVDKTLPNKKVLFEAEWKEPPIICKNCGKKKEHGWAYPEDKPSFCNKYCFHEYMVYKSE